MVLCIYMLSFMITLLKEKKNCPKVRKVYFRYEFSDIWYHTSYTFFLSMFCKSFYRSPFFTQLCCVSLFFFCYCCCYGWNQYPACKTTVSLAIWTQDQSHDIKLALDLFSCYNTHLHLYKIVCTVSSILKFVWLYIDY